MAKSHAIGAVVVVDGWELERELEGSLQELVVDDHEQLPAMFTITLADPKRDILDRCGMRVGASVEISTIGQVDDTIEPLIKGDVVAIECEYDRMGSRVIVRGYASSHRLHRGRNTRTFVNVTDGDIVTRVAQEAGLDVGSVDDTGNLYEHVTQPNISDWDFLTGRARHVGFELAVTDNKVEFRAPTRAADAPAPTTSNPMADPVDPRQLVLGRNLISFRGRLSGAEQVAEVEVRGWDTARKDAVVSRVGAATTVAELDLADPPTMAEFFGSRKFVHANAVLADDVAAEDVAKALAERIASAFVEVEGVTYGHPVLRAGVAVTISEVGEDFSGKYVLSHVRHIIDRNGYQTHFTVSGRQDRSLFGVVSSAASGAAGLGDRSASSIAGLVRGVVDDVDDPLQQGRVRIRLPWLNDDFVSNWAPVMQLGAGPKSGTLFIPAVNDEVLVGFEHGLVDRPVVVGGLFNGVDEPPEYSHYLEHGQVVHRGIYSRLGHRLMFNDARDLSGITVSTSDSSVSIGLNARDQKLVLQAQGSIEIEALGDMRLRGTNVNVEASGQLVLKGAQIKLN